MLSVRRLVIMLLACAATAAAMAPPATAVTITDIGLAGGRNPGDVAYAPDGSVWVSAVAYPGASPNFVARYRAGVSSYFQHGGALTEVLGPITPGPQGVMWFAGCHCTGDGMAYTYIGRLALDGTIIELPLPAGQRAGAITAGPDGNLWFTDSVTGRVGRMTPEGISTEFPGTSPGSYPGPIVVGPDGNLWFIESGGHIGRITPAGIVTEFPIPADVYPGEGLTAGPDGRIWFTTYDAVYAMDMTGTVVAKRTHPSHEIHPGAITVGPDGNLWFTEPARNAIARLSPSGRIVEFTEGISQGGTVAPRSITAGGGSLWFTGNSGQDGATYRVDLDPPSAGTTTPSGLSTTAATFSAPVDPRGASTSVRFEYGTSAAFGASTPAQPVGDGDGAVLAATSVDGLLPGTTYHVRAVATSPVGTTVGPAATFTTPTPPPVVVVVSTDPDTDADGYPSTVDCADTDPTRHPGATDTPADGIDQDCNGADATWPRLSPRITASWNTYKKHHYSVFTRLSIRDLRAGTTVSLSCVGPGCRLRPWTTRVMRSGTLQLGPRLASSHLRHGAVLELRIQRAGAVGMDVRWKVGPPPHAVVACLPPGSARAVRC